MQTNKNPGIAAVLSFFIPGLGQIYCERIGRGILWLVFAIVGYLLFIVPGIIVAILATFDALKLARAINEGKKDYELLNQEGAKPSEKMSATKGADIQEAERYSTEKVVEQKQRNSDARESWKKNKNWYVAGIAATLLLVLLHAYSTGWGLRGLSLLKSSNSSVKEGRIKLLSVRDYLQYVQPIITTGTLSPFSEIGATGNVAMPTDESLSKLNSAKSQFLATKSSLERIDPPPQVLEEHNAFITGIDNFIKAVDVLSSDFAVRNQNKVDEAQRYFKSGLKKIDDAFYAVNAKAQQTAIPQKNSEAKAGGTKTSNVTSSQATQLPVQPPPPPPTIPTRFEGIAGIKLMGGIWDNWDADIEKDGPFVAIIYLDRDDEFIRDAVVYKVPISADVKVYAGHSTDSRLVFSSHYTDKQMVPCVFYDKCIRIPREEMSVNTATDNQFGDVEVTIHTPEQGDFSARSDFIVLYLKK